MSIEQPLDPQLIEQTKQQIRSLVAEIARLSKTEVAPEEFYGEFLPRVVSALAAVGGAVWALNPEGQLALQYQINIQEAQLRQDEKVQAQHARLLYKALATSEGMLVPPHSGPGESGVLEPLTDDTPAANPTAFLLVLGQLKTDLETVGVVEIFQRADSAPSTQQGYLRFLLQMCALAGDFLKSHQLRHFSHRQTLWAQLEDFTRVVHGSLEPRETAYTIANEGRRLIECDRVSVAIRRGKKCVIESISGQDLFDKRSNTVRLLGKLATAVVTSGDTVWYTGDTRDLPPQVEDAVQAYVDEAHSKTVAVLPLQRPAPPEDEEHSERTKAEPPIGALIIEQIEDSRVGGALVQRAEVVCRHSSTALANALEHQNLFLMPVWRALGKARWVVQTRTLPKTLTITAVVLAVLAGLAMWPAAFTLESKGTLEPVVRQDVFAGIDGRVEELFCAHGDTVPKDKTLARLQNPDLEVAISGVTGDRLANSERLNAVRHSLVVEKKLSVDERIRLEGERMELEQKALTFDNQWALYKIKQKELDVKSPITGLVVTWDVRNRLIHRPVKQGQLLLRVADPAGPWQLELHMAENRVGHIVEYQHELYEKAREKLREMLREETRAKLGEAAAAEDVDKAVDAALAAIPDEKLHEKIVAQLRQRLGNQLQALMANVSDQDLKAKLDAVLKEKTYDDARAKLEAILPDVNDAELAGRLRELAAEAPEASSDVLSVSYILATEPGTTHWGTVKEIHRSAEVRPDRPDEGNTVLIKVAIDKTELPNLRPGATVTAHVYCGKQPLGYVLLHDVIAFIESKVLFRYF
jgi:multidrug efflux pump subunit AcrA (membrane-fusion protein)